MKKAVTLEAFVAAFTDVMNEPCSPQTWIWADLKLDDDELDWMFCEMSVAGHATPVGFDGDPLKYLPNADEWPFGRRTCSDLTIKELYSFCQFEGDA